MFKALCTIIVLSLSVIYSSQAQTTITTFQGNDNNNDMFLGHLSTIGYEFFSKKDVDGGFTGDTFTLTFDNSKSGTWDSGLTQVSGIVIKGSNQFLFVDFGSNTQTSGNWCTNACLINGVNAALWENDKNPGLSHLTLYTAISPVPEASTFALMLSGLGLVGFMVRKRQK